MPYTLRHLIETLTITDGIAVLFLFASAWLIGWRIENPSASRASVSALMADYRRDWMQAYLQRENRIFDSQILISLRQGTSFYASTSLVALGALLALIGNTDPISGLAHDLASTDAPALVWQVKLMVPALFMVNAFLRFVWAHRIFGYCSVVMATVTDTPDDPERQPRARQAGELNIRAAVNFNRGLRAIYFALGALAWLVGAWVLIAATIITCQVLWRREFSSLPRKIIAERRAQD